MSVTMRAHCDKCQGFTNQESLFSLPVKGSEADDYGNYYEWEDKYEVLKCCGCDRVSYRTTSWNNAETTPDGDPVKDTVSYPPPTVRRLPPWLFYLEDPLGLDLSTVGQLLTEIYSALHAHCRRLAVMGIRALLEHMMIEKVNDHGSFQKNLQQFEGAGYISKIQKETIEPVLEAGHAAIHRNWAPSSSDITSLLDITENLVETIYVSQKKSADMRPRVPPRKRA